MIQNLANDLRIVLVHPEFAHLAVLDLIVHGFGEFISVNVLGVGVLEEDLIVEDNDAALEESGHVQGLELGSARVNFLVDGC